MSIDGVEENLLRASEVDALVTDATAVVRFAIGGPLRFLSHAETVRVFERACARAGVPVKYSQGFNPHAKLSLPLPRSVGVASDDEVLILRVFDPQGFPLAEAAQAARARWQERTAAQLADVLPAEIVVHTVTLTKSSVSYHPASAEYHLALQADACLDAGPGLRGRMADLLAHEHLVVDRIKPNRRSGRSLDVRPFLKSMRLEETQAIVECGISDAGSIRVDEILTLLALTPTDLAGPIRRTNITWKIT